MCRRVNVCSARPGGTGCGGLLPTGGRRRLSPKELVLLSDAHVGAMARNDKRRAAVTRLVEAHLGPDVLLWNLMAAVTIQGSESR